MPALIPAVAAGLRRRAALAIASALALPACAPEPAYPPPNDGEAKAAYIRAIRADLIEAPAKPARPPEATRLRPDETPESGLRKVGEVLGSETERQDRLMARSDIRQLARVALGACTWDDVDPEEIGPYGRARVEAAGIAQGYRCAFTAFSDTDTRGLVSAAGTGWFFRRDGDWDFGSLTLGSWERAAPRTGN